MIKNPYIIPATLIIASISLFLYFYLSNPQNMSREISIEKEVEEEVVFKKEVDTPDGDNNKELIEISLLSESVTFENGEEATLKVPEGFSVSVAAENLGKARFMTMSPDERVFIPDMVDFNLSHEGKIIILDDFNEETKQFESQTAYLSNLRGPHSVEFYTDSEDNDWIYIALTEHLVRYPYSAGDTEPSGEPEIIFEFPNEQNPTVEESVVWHITRTILFDEDTMYLSIGSGCNVCEESYEEDGRPAIITMTPEGKNVELYAEGIKNAVGIELVDGNLYATENGVDHISPNDSMIRVKKGAHYGWPYCYELGGQKHLDTAIEWENPMNCDEVPTGLTAFNPHSAPLGIKYFENAHPFLQENFLVALQGSWNIDVGNGYKVMRVTKDGEQEVFIDGFLREDENGEPERVGRPVGVLQFDENSFFVSDDWNGRVYYFYSE